MTSQDKVGISPHTSMILSEIEREHMTWEKALGEPIDNSLDAGATRVTISIDKREKRVRIDDNGSGSNEPHMMFVSGYTTKKRRRRSSAEVKDLGRYGVGLKHASHYLCGADGTTTVVTGNPDRYQKVQVRWRDVISSGLWEIDAPIDLPPEAAEPVLHGDSGTSLTFQPITRTLPYASTYEKLAFTFSPALRSGKQIEIAVNGKSRTLSAPREPSYSEPVEFEVSVGQKTARVRAGILALNDKSGRRGLSFCYGHRVIISDTQAGCGSHSTQGFAGIVELDNRWALGVNKSEVSDRAWAELCDKIEERLKPLLDKLRNSAQQIHSEALRNSIAGTLKDAMRKTGEKRGPYNLTGRYRGQKKHRAKEGVPINIDWVDEPDVEEAARVDPTGRCVYLNRAKSMVARAVDDQDNDMLAVIAASHLFHSDSRETLFGNRMFGDLMGELLNKPLTLEPVGGAKC